MPRRQYYPPIDPPIVPLLLALALGYASPKSGMVAAMFIAVWVIFKPRHVQIVVGADGVSFRGFDGVQVRRFTGFGDIASVEVRESKSTRFQKKIVVRIERKDGTDEEVRVANPDEVLNDIRRAQEMVTAARLESQFGACDDDLYREPAEMTVEQRVRVVVDCSETTEARQEQFAQLSRAHRKQLLSSLADESFSELLTKGQ